MALSTKTLELQFNVIAAQGIPDVRTVAGGYGDDLAFELANDVIADLITERFPWKFNRWVATPFYTNSFQQDYPQPAQTSGIIGWGETCDYVNINSSLSPKPINVAGPVLFRKQLDRTNLSQWRPFTVCWMYNQDLTWGTWPGAGVVYYPRVVAGPTQQNPIMNFVDVNGNYLILTGFGTTGGSAPAAPASSPEGTTVADGSCVWYVVSGTSQGFRIDNMPSATSPVYQMIPSYQAEPPQFTDYKQLLTPIPDSFSRYFLDGLTAVCLLASMNPADKQRGEQAYGIWMRSLEMKIKQQANKEQDAFGMVPASAATEDRWGWCGPRTVDRPY